MALSTPLPLGANGIQLINEDDRWSFLLGQGEGIPDQLGTISDEHLHQLGASQLQEGGLGVVGVGVVESSQRHHERSLWACSAQLCPVPLHPFPSAHLGLCSTGPGQQGLPCTRGPIHQHTLWRLDPQVLKLLLVVHWQDDGLYQLPGRSPE